MFTVEAPMTASPDSNDDTSIEFQVYQDESQLGEVMKLVLQDLSEPYSSKKKRNIGFLVVFFFVAFFSRSRFRCSLCFLLSSTTYWFCFAAATTTYILSHMKSIYIPLFPS